jgi:Tfp pilus assembly protein PilX
MKKLSKLSEEDGSILIVTLIILVLLTLLGIFATKTTEVEIQIAGNDMRYKRNLYSADAAAMECAGEIGAMTVIDTDAHTWLLPMSTAYTRDDILGTAFWTANATGSGAVSNADCLAIFSGIAENTSLDMTKSKIYVFDIYGRFYNAANTKEGKAIVKAGLKKAL